MSDKKRSQLLDGYKEPDETQPEQENPEVSASSERKRGEHFTPGTFVRPARDKSAQIKTPARTRKVSRKMVIGGIIASILVLATLGGLVAVKFVTLQSDVTAFQVGAQQKTTQPIGGGGIVYPLQQLDVSYPVAERVLAVLVKAGDQVKANQPLIKLDPTQLNAQITQASNNVAAAQAYLDSVSNAFPYNAVTVAAAQQALQNAQSRYNALLAQASSPTMQNGNLISTLSGVVTAVNINAGEVFGANTILMTIMNQSAVVVRANIPLANLGQVHLGMPAQVNPSALPNLTISGTVVSVIPQADPQTDTFGVWVQIANPQQNMLPGMSAFVNIQTPINAYVVPRLAVLNPDHESSVFVIRNGHAIMQPVQVVGRNANSVFVGSGLTPGEQILVLPMDKVLHDGQAVRVTALEH